jgi:hypothetical protein
MCDTCSRIFSENEDGWATGSIQQMHRAEDGVMRPKAVQQDACPDCNTAGHPVNLRPKAEAYTGELSRARKINELEQEAGIGSAADG